MDIFTSSVLLPSHKHSILWFMFLSDLFKTCSLTHIKRNANNCLNALKRKAVSVNSLTFLSSVVIDIKFSMLRKLAKKTLQ